MTKWDFRDNPKCAELCQTSHVTLVSGNNKPTGQYGVMTYSFKILNVPIISSRKINKRKSNKPSQILIQRANSKSL